MIRKIFRTVELESACVNSLALARAAKRQAAQRQWQVMWMRNGGQGEIWEDCGGTVATSMTRRETRTCMAPGTKNAQRHASNSGTFLAMAVVRYGMMICVAPPPAHPKPQSIQQFTQRLLAL